MKDLFYVLGYHGTSEEAAKRILSEGFRISRNEYDWLGDGVYFFQDAPYRSWEWAKNRYGSKSAVIGAKIRLENCMDLLDIQWVPVISEIYNSFLTQFKKANLPLPRQSKGSHRLDRQVINYMVGNLREKEIHIRSVRAAFTEGIPVFKDSAIFTHSHVQIAVRDTAVIEEYWLEK